MRGHYAMWAVMACAFVVIGALYEGQKAMIKREAAATGASMILKDLTPEELSQLRV